MNEPLYYCSRSWVPIGNTGHCWPAYFGVVAKNTLIGKHYEAKIDHNGFFSVPLGWQVKPMDYEALYDLVRDSFEPWNQITRTQFYKLMDSYIMPPFRENNEH